jgi:hypothetical protein
MTNMKYTRLVANNIMGYRKRIKPDQCHNCNKQIYVRSKPLSEVPDLHLRVQATEKTESNLMVLFN